MDLLKRITEVNKGQEIYETMPGNHAPRLTPDLTYWAMQGVQTPEDLDALLAVEPIGNHTQEVADRTWQAELDQALLDDLLTAELVNEDDGAS